MKKIWFMKKLALLIFIPVMACGSSYESISEKNETVTETKKAEIVLEKEKPEQEKPRECLKPFGETPEDSLETRKNISLFTQEFNAEKYESAYPYWQYIIDNAPCLRVGPYIDGITMLEKFIANPEYADKREVLIDSLLMLFPMRIKFHGEEGLVKGYWIYYLNLYRPDEYMEIINLGDKSMELQRDQSQYIVPSVYMTAILKAFKAKKINAEKVFNAYEKVNIIIDENIKNENEHLEIWKQVQANIDNAVKPILKCDDIDNIIYPRIKETPDDIEMKKKVVRFYRAANCTGNNNYINTLNDVFIAQPEATSAEELAKYYELNNNLNKANFYWEKAAELETDNKKKEYYYIKLASNSLKSNNMNSAVNFANKILSINSNNGNAYIIMGIAKFNQAQTNCEKPFDKAAAAWVAIDYMEKAIASDPGVKEDAQAKITNYKKNAPPRELGFFNNVMEGDPYTVNCINASTIARYYD